MLSMQLPIFVIATIFGCLGNAGALAVSRFSCTYKTGYFTFLVALDLLSVIFGPLLGLASASTDSSWLREHPAACKTLGFFKTIALFAPIFALLCLTLYCRHICHSVQKPSRGLRVFMFTLWVPVLVISVPPLGKWNSFAPQVSLRSCWHNVASSDVEDLGYTFFVGSVAFIVNAVTLGLAFAGLRAQRRYRLRLQWLRHRMECKMNDPERTTVQSSNASSSRSSSFENLLVALANSKNAVTGTMKTLQERLQEEVKRQDSADKVPAETTGSPSKIEIIEGGFQYRAHAPVGLTRCLEVTPPHYARRRTGFTTRLARFRDMKSTDFATRDKNNAQFLKLLTVFSFLSLIGWLPYYVIEIQAAFHVQISKGMLALASWLPFLRSVISPILYVVLSSVYRKACATFLRRIGCLTARRKLSQRQGSLDLSKLSLQYTLQEGNRSVSLVNVYDQDLRPFKRITHV